MFAIAVAASLLVSPAPENFRAETEMLAACGMAAERVTVRYEEELQSPVATIGGADHGEDAIACVADAAARTAALVQFTEPPVHARYQAASREAFGRFARDEARRWLGARGRLDALPVYDPQRQTLAGFVRSIERFCGVRPGRFLRVYEGGLTFARPAALPRMREERFACLLHSAIAADLGARGVEFGIVGSGPAPE